MIRDDTGPASGADTSIEEETLIAIIRRHESKPLARLSNTRCYHLIERETDRVVVLYNKRDGSIERSMSVDAYGQLDLSSGLSDRTHTRYLALRSHFKKRVRERFDLNLTDQDVDRIANMIQKGEAQAVGRRSRNESNHIVTYRGVTMEVGYSTKWSVPITALYPKGDER